MSSPLSALVAVSLVTAGATVVDPIERASGDRPLAPVHEHLANGDQAAALDAAENLCEEDVAEACAYAAAIWVIGKTVDSDPARARAFSDRACVLGAPLGCAMSGDMRAELAGLDLLLQYDALEWYARACDLGDDASCALAVTWHVDAGVFPSDALAGFRALCASDRPVRHFGCVGVSMRVFDDRAEPSDIEPSTALEHFEAACRANVGIGCQLAVALSRRSRQDEPLSAHELGLAERGCLLGRTDVCGTLGETYEFGDGTEKDVGAALHAYTLGCKFGSLDACNDVAAVLRSADSPHRDYERAFALHEYVCLRGNPSACNSAGYLLQWEVPGARPAAIAHKYYLYSCENGWSNGCYNLGRCYEFGRCTELDLEASAHYYGASCRMRNEFGCGEYGDALLNGIGAEPDPTTAGEVLGWACTSGDPWACVQEAYGARAGVLEGGLERAVRAFDAYAESYHEFGVFHRDLTRDLITARDALRAESLASLEQACSGWDTEACTRLAIRHLDETDEAFSRSRHAKPAAMACRNRGNFGCALVTLASLLDDAATVATRESDLAAAWLDCVEGEVASDTVDNANWASCSVFALFRGLGADFEIATDLLRPSLSCAEASAVQCANLLHGIGFDRNPSDAGAWRAWSDLERYGVLIGMCRVVDETCE